MLAPRRSLHRLRTIFTSSSTSDSANASSQSSRATTISIPANVMSETSGADLLTPRTPLHTPYSPASDSCYSPMPWTPDTWASPELSPSGTHRAIRKKKSKVEIRQHEERQQVSVNLLGLIEPRPGTGVASGGIEEILSGEA